jgi:hypothetical protein
MDEPVPQLQRVQGPRDRHPATRLVWVVVVVAATFLAGLGLGSRLAPAPTPTATAPTAFVAAQVSHELWTAYLNRGTEGWGLCELATEISCQPIAAAPAALFVHFEDLPLKVSAQDWIVPSPITVPAGHYILASPMLRPLGPYVTFAGVSPDGVGTLIGPAGQATLNEAVWARSRKPRPGTLCRHRRYLRPGPTDGEHDRDLDRLGLWSDRQKHALIPLTNTHQEEPAPGGARPNPEGSFPLDLTRALGGRRGPSIVSTVTRPSARSQPRRSATRSPSSIGRSRAPTAQVPSEGSMARLDPAGDDQLTKEVERAITIRLASMTGVTDTVAGDHDGPLNFPPLEGPTPQAYAEEM